jgi:hypothetical protein
MLVEKLMLLEKLPPSNRVEEGTLGRLLGPQAYRADFLMFGYSAQAYLTRLGLPFNTTVVDI